MLYRLEATLEIKRIFVVEAPNQEEARHRAEVCWGEVYHEGCKIKECKIYVQKSKEKTPNAHTDAMQATLG
jgi:hypothetical protein